MRSKTILYQVIIVVAEENIFLSPNESRKREKVQRAVCFFHRFFATKPHLVSQYIFLNVVYYFRYSARITKNQNPFMEVAQGGVRINTI